MPSMYVNVPRLEQETKNTLVAKLYDAAAPVLKAPHIYTFVNEYETLYENGQPARGGVGGSGRGQGPDPGLPRQRPGPHCHWRRDHCHEDEKVSCETGNRPLFIQNRGRFCDRERS